MFMVVPNVFIECSYCGRRHDHDVPCPKNRIIIETDSPELRQHVKRFEFVKSTVKIKRIKVTANGIQIQFSTTDIQSGFPVDLTFTSGFTPGHLQAYPNPEQALGQALRWAFRELFFHEVDECLLRDGDFLNNPHPEKNYSLKG